ncbi:MAG: hypothetical protein GY841_17865 [FCB group bacterium]|nr:hypothetical protein [FCB group bacterium]
MLSRNLSVIVILFAMFSTFSICQADEDPAIDQRIILDKTYELFLRAKVNDKAVMYENEFPYLREERDLEEYLANKYVKAYNADTLVALQVDSVLVTGDSALSYLRLEFVQADSSFNISEMALRWRKYDDVWIKPSLSEPAKQLEFEEELRIYWEAVREMEKDATKNNNAEEDRQ